MSERVTIDWDALWSELNWDDPHRHQHQLRERLQQRAQQYSQPLVSPVTNTDMADHQQVLVFRLGTERYGVDIMAVRQVRPLQRLTRLPAVPAFYRGVTNLRGQIISVLDLRLFFNVSPTQDPSPTELVVVRAHTLELALLAHHVEEVSVVPPHHAESLDMPFASRITATGLVILDLETLFSDPRLIIQNGDESL